MATASKLTILDVSGPFREPREQVFSYDYSIQRSNWPLPHAVRVKVGIPEELDVLRSKLLGTLTGTPGQQLLVSQVLSRRIADEKMRLAESNGELLERREVVLPPYTGPVVHLFPKLEEWLERDREALRAEIKKRANL
jgi:hypothetical protein